jgi:NADH dehydrogenase
MKKNVLIIGGSGYLGTNIIRYFDNFNYINISKTKLLQNVSNNILLDISKGIDFLRFDAKIDLIINASELYACEQREVRCYADTLKGIVSLMEKIQVDKVVHFSNYVSDNTYKTDYMHNKLLADRIIEHSGKNYIIFKTTQIFGNNSIFENFVKSLKNASFLPRDIAYKRIAPVFIGDVLKNIEYAFRHQESWNKTYLLCGPEFMQIDEAVNRYKDNGKIKILNLPRAIEKSISKLYL